MQINNNTTPSQSWVYVYHDHLQDQDIDIQQDTELSVVAIDSKLDHRYNISGWSKLDLRVIMLSTKQDSTTNIDVLLDQVWSQADVYILNFVISNKQTKIDGKIRIWSNWKDTSWHLLEENIILSDSGNIHTIPILDVKNNQVSASHGAKITRFDTEKIFYLTSRWLDRQQSIQLLIKSYIDNIFFGNDDKDLEIIKNQIINQVSSYIV